MENTTRARRKPRRFLRYGLRALLLLVAAAAIALGYGTHRLRARKAAVVAIQEAGGTMGFRRMGPEWLRSVVDDELAFRDPGRVTLSRGTPRLECDDAKLQSLSFALVEFGRLEVLDARSASITDASTQVFSQLGALSHLRLSDTGIGDASIERIRDLPRLEYLWLDRTKVTDACIDDLCRLTTLKDLTIRETAITAEGAAELQKRLPACKVSR